MVGGTDEFEVAHAAWLEGHRKTRQGERKRRLSDGHGHAEKAMLKNIWWPAFGRLDFLHPEFEMTDFVEGRRYIDLAYIRLPIKIAFEVDGYGPHTLQLSRDQFSNQWVRQMHLLNDNWIVVRISFDDVKSRPRLWQQLIQQMIGRLFGEQETATSDASGIADKEIVRLAMRLGGIVKLSDVMRTIPCGYRTARTALDRLVERQWFVPFGGGPLRTHSWKLAMNGRQIHKLNL